MADELFKTMVKKFGTQLKVWTGYAEFLMGRGHYEAARRVLERSLKSLPKAQRGWSKTGCVRKFKLDLCLIHTIDQIHDLVP